MNKHIQYWLQVTDDLSDAEFESVISDIRGIRHTRAVAVAQERQDILALGEPYLRRALANSAEGRRRELIASYNAAGLTSKEIDGRLRELFGR